MLIFAVLISMFYSNASQFISAEHSSYEFIGERKFSCEEIEYRLKDTNSLRQIDFLIKEYIKIFSRYRKFYWHEKKGPYFLRKLREARHMLLLEKKRLEALVPKEINQYEIIHNLKWHIDTIAELGTLETVNGIWLEPKYNDDKFIKIMGENGKLSIAIPLNWIQYCLFPHNVQLEINNGNTTLEYWAE